MRSMLKMLLCAAGVVVTAACTHVDTTTTERSSNPNSSSPNSNVYDTLDVSKAYQVIATVSGHCLDVGNPNTLPGAIVDLATCSNSASQAWQPHVLPGSSYAFANVYSSLQLTLQGVGEGVSQGNVVVSAAQEWQLLAQDGNSFLWVNADRSACLTAGDGNSVSVETCSGNPNQLWGLQAATIAPPPNPGPHIPSLPLHVAGNQLLNSANEVVRLQGVNIASMVWTDLGELPFTTSPPPCSADQTIFSTIQEAMTVWHANHIRLALNPDRWWNSTGNANEIRSLVDSIVVYVANQGGYINLDMHVSDAGVWGANPTQHGLPDVNTQTVLADVAKRYANNPAVLFGIYNEPQEITWDQWLNGGEITDITNTTFMGVGMQAMVDTVRAAGANNVVIVDGIFWSSELQGVVNGYAVNDPNVVYDAHVYPPVGDVAQWNAKVGVVAATYPLYVGEFGPYFPNGTSATSWSSSTAYVQAVLQWIDQSKFSYAAWTFGADAPPILLSDWCYTPTSDYGALVYQYMTTGSP